MKIVAPASTVEALQNQGSSVKCVFNETGAILFPATNQHRDMKMPGVSYEDDHKGNALAAMVTPGKFEIRYHGQFSDSRVTLIMSKLLAEPEFAFAASYSVTYQNRRIAITPPPAHSAGPNSNLEE